MNLQAAIRAIRGFRLDRRTAAALLLIAAALFVMRKPDAVVRPQFWAEDGAVWFADAYNEGPVRSLLKTQDGYFSTYLRIAADAALALPLASAPLFFALVALALQLAPAALFLSSRFRGVVRSDALRVAVVALYVLAPNVGETQLNATNAQWYLALLAFLVVVAARPPDKAWRAFDAAVLALSGLSGPYAIFLLPVVALAWFHDRDRRRLPQSLLLAACAAVQLTALFVTNRGARVSVLPDMHAMTLLFIMAKQVWFGAVAGSAGRAAVSAGGAAGFLSAAATVAALAVVAYAAKRAPLILRAFLAFAFINLAASLLVPNIGMPNTDPAYAGAAWPAMLASDSGSRYWLIPVLAFLMALLYSAVAAKPRFVRATALVFLAFLPLGIFSDFRAAPPADKDYPGHVAAFLRLPSGEESVFPLDPAGWEMRLRRK